MALHLKIVTPTREVLSEEVDEISAKTADGQIGILPNHVGLLTRLVPGELIVRKGGKPQAFAILGGFLEVADNNVNVLADYAIRAEDIEIAKVQEAHERAKKAVQEKKGQEDFVVAEAELRKSIMELEVAKKYRPKINRSA